MLFRSFRGGLTALVLAAVSMTGTAVAQPAAPNQAPPSGTPEVLPPAPAEGAAAEGDKKEPARPVTPAAGYAYADKRAASSSPHGHYRRSGPVVNIPGFEQSGDGGSRLFVQLSQSVKVEERRAQGSITYVLKGASPRVWNNTNALVTVHFNTPVSRARLVPVGQDLHFIVELRAAVSPTWKVDESQDRSAMLAIDFPKGDYLNLPVPAPVSAAGPAPKGVRGKRAGARLAAPPPPAAPKP